MKIGVFSAIILILSGSIAYCCGDYPPVADLTVDPISAAVDEDITFDGSASYDSDGTITKYEWQWTTGGVWEDTNTTEIVTHSYDTRGFYNVTLRVTDNDNYTDTYTTIVVVFSDPIYVDSSVSDGNNDGSNWANAYNYLQDAFDAASAGDVIWVANGIYKPDEGSGGHTLNDPDETFQLIQEVAVYGGFGGYNDGNETSPSQRDFVNNKAILSGDIGIENDVNDNCYHVVTGADEAILDGFTITGGNAGGSWAGGGMLNIICSPTVSNCSFVDNRGGNWGGGMCNYESSPTVSNCSFVDNTAVYGAGMFNIADEYSVCSPTVSNCSFVDNTAVRDGGGMFSIRSSPTVSNCSFVDNTAGGDFGGGGMYSYSCSLTITNCVFNSNSAMIGGGIYTVGTNSSITNCVFYNNNSFGDPSSGGAGAYLHGSTTVTNCTFYNNYAEGSGLGGGILLYGYNNTVKNSIFWNNTDSGTGTVESEQIHDESGAWITYSCIQDADPNDAILPFNDGSNIDDNPKFVNDANPDGADNIWATYDDGLRLGADSPCIDKGNDSDVGITTDIAGRPRIFDGDHQITSPDTDYPTVDMGAYEYCAVHNVTQDTGYSTIQSAIDGANDYDVIEVGAGTFRENIDFDGVNCTLRSTDPNDPCVVEATIIDGNDSGVVVTFDSGEDANSVLKGLTIRKAGTYGIKCSGTSPVITDCIIEDSGTYGIYLESSAAPVIERNKIRDNTTGIFIAYSDGSVSIKNNWIYNNSDKGIEDMYSSNITICNNTIVDNFIGIWAVGTYINPTISNCIIWNNNYELSGCDATYSCIEGGGYGTGNISSDPYFVDYANDDFHLTSDSLCIDAGDPDYVPTDDEKDIDGDWRLRATAIDMGADEFGKVIYVDADVATGGDGSSWSNAFKYLQDGLGDAEVGDEIWVADGNYYPDENTSNPTGTDDRNSTFLLVSKVAIYGGFAGGPDGETKLEQRSLTDNKCILSGDIDVEDTPLPEGETIYTRNSYHVVTGADNAVLDGLTITNGYVEEASIPGGAGLYCNDTSPTIRNCIITNNFAKADRYGGGIYTTGDSNPLLINCLVAGNFAQKDHCGGIYHTGTGTLELINSTVVDNAFDGIHCDGAVLSIDNSIIWHNRFEPDDLIEFPVREIVLTNGAEATLRYSNIDNGQSGIIVDGSILNWGVGNISDDPQFEDWGNWEWKLADGNNVQLGTTFQASANEITIYDLKKQFADVDLGMNHHEDDFIQDYLDTNPSNPTYKKPIWQQTPGDTSTVSNVDNFNLWFSDDPDPDKGSPIQTNQNIPSWVCINKDEGVFRLDSYHFFPIDDWCSDPDYGCDGDRDCLKFCANLQEFTCEYVDHCSDHPGSFSCDYADCTNEHDYFFTLQYHTKVRYIPGQTLRFISSDDLFVAINDAIVVNRAGYFVDCPSDTEILLDDGDIYVYRHNYGICGSDATEKFFDLNLQPYEEYDFDIFFAQRRRPLSVLVVERTPGESEIVASFSLGDYHLINDGVNPSPCIDAGDYTMVPVGTEKDLDSLVRFKDHPEITPHAVLGETSPVDMGAYEYQPPTANPDEYEVEKNTVLNIAAPGVLANDEDPIGGGLVATVAVQPTNEQVFNFGTDGSFYYEPTTDWYGIDTFTYRITDAEDIDSFETTVTINVLQDNEPPVANDDVDPGYTTTKNSTLNVSAPGVLGNDTDPDGDNITAELFTDDTPGNLTLNSDGSFTYEPLGTTGIYYFSYNAVDENLEPSITPADVKIVVTNQPPVADAGSDQPSLLVCDSADLIQVTLDGSASTDPDSTNSPNNDNDIVSYVWSWTDDSGPQSANGEVANVWMETGTYEVTLEVTDYSGSTDTDTVQITISEQAGPTASASDLNITDGGSGDNETPLKVNGAADVQFDGSASTGNIAQYKWYRNNQKIAEGVNPTVRLGIGTHNLILVVINNCGKTDTDDFTVTVSRPPLTQDDVDAGPAQEVDLPLSGAQQQLHGDVSPEPPINGQYSLCQSVAVLLGKLLPTFLNQNLRWKKVFRGLMSFSWRALILLWP